MSKNLSSVMELGDVSVYRRRDGLSILISSDEYSQISDDDMKTILIQFINAAHSARKEQELSEKE